MVAAIKYDSKVWAASVAVSWARESNERTGGDERPGCEEAWRALDRQLRTVAARRAALDAEELALIRKAIAIQIWRALGMSSMREYLEHRMGYGPRVASERLRVADALEGLPMMEAALDAGELSYSAVRELTRIATRKTEEAWLDACRGKVLRQIEELVAEREPGDGPDAAPKPDLRPKRVSMDLRPAVVARMRQAQAALDAVRGERNDYNELLDEAFRCLLMMHGSSDAPEDARRATGSVQIATITKCESCGQGWQIAAGRRIALTPAELETAECDAVNIGSLDGPPKRASSTIPPKTKKRVKQRDHYRCTVPWCRAAANIDVHHLEHREHGGGHEPENLTCLCSGHHAAYHRGEMLIEGRAPTLTFRRRQYMVDARHDRADGVPCIGKSNSALAHVGESSRVLAHVGESSRVLARVGELIPDALLALTTLGFKKPEAQRAVTAARAQMSATDGLEALIRAALRELR